MKTFDVLLFAFELSSLDATAMSLEHIPNPGTIIRAIYARLQRIMCLPFGVLKSDVKKERINTCVNGEICHDDRAYDGDVEDAMSINLDVCDALAVRDFEDHTLIRHNLKENGSMKIGRRN